MRQGLAAAVVAIALLASPVFPDGRPSSTGSVQGAVFTLDSKGNRSVISAAKISLDGPKNMETESGGDGLFAFSAVPPGSYKISAQAPGIATASKQSFPSSAAAVRALLPLILRGTLVRSMRIGC